MQLRKTLIVVLVSSVGCLPAPFVRAEDEQAFSYQTVTTKEGLSYRVPEDMPIENRNGIQAPIPFDEYMYGKFKQLEKKIDAVDAKLERIEALIKELRDRSASAPKVS